MIFPERYRYTIVTIFLLIWAYLFYCYLFEYNPHSHARRYNYKARVDSTISLLESWKYLIYSESILRVKKSNYVRDSVLRELKKKPKVLVVPKEVIVEKPIYIESAPKMNMVNQDLFKDENESLKAYNQKLQREVDSMGSVLKELKIKKSLDSTKYKEMPEKRRFLWFRQRKSKAPTGIADPKPEFR
jgi:hypothetical protein